MSDFLYFRFDVTGMTDAEQDALAGEVICQGESSEGHGNVEGPTQSFSRAELGQQVRRGIVKAYPNLSDETTEEIAEAVADSIGDPLAPGDGPNAIAVIRYDDEAGEIVDDMPMPTRKARVAMYDPSDPDDGPLFAMEIAGSEIRLYAPDCVEEGELERRLVRWFGTDGWEIVDFKLMVG